MVTQTRQTKNPSATGVSDAVLVKRIRQALYDIKRLRALHSRIQVEASNGVATLRGVVATYDLKKQALDAARNVPGVQDVQDALLAEPDLEIGIAQALAADPRTHQAVGGILVYATNDHVVLAGQVSDPAVAQLAETIALAVPGVRTVINHLQIASGSRSTS